MTTDYTQLWDASAALRIRQRAYLLDRTEENGRLVGEAAAKLDEVLAKVDCGICTTCHRPKRHLTPIMACSCASLSMPSMDPATEEM